MAILVVLEIEIWEQEQGQARYLVSNARRNCAVEELENDEELISWIKDQIENIQRSNND